MSPAHDHARPARSGWITALRSYLRPFPLLSLLVMFFLACCADERTRADELVQVAPHQAAVSLAANDRAPPLLGLLARPYGPGPFPAVVLLHWCSGFGGHDTEAATLLRSWGYVALALDSLGDANMCQANGGAVAEAADAYAALHFLQAQSFIAPDRIAVMGWSMGATAALMATEQGFLQRLHQAQFRATIAYYPQCQGSSGTMAAPTLVLIGADDDWTPAASCQRMAAHESEPGITRTPAAGAPLTLVVYPGATHAFDSATAPHRYLGHVLRYDAAAAQDAAQRVRAFLQQTLPRPTSVTTPSDNR